MIFELRLSCEVCESRDFSDLVDISMSKPPLSDFLASYYNERIPKELFTEDNFLISKCEKCDFIWQRKVLNKQYMKELYSKWIDSEISFKKSQSHGSSYFKMLKKDALFVSLITEAKTRDSKVLDFGLGWGNWASACISEGLNVFGMELAPEKVANAKKIGVNMLSSLNDHDEFFDYINSEQVFEHICSPGEHMALLSKSLKKGGLLRITVPAYPREAISTQSYIPRADCLHPLEHINTFKTKNLLDLARKYDLKLVQDIELLLIALKNFKNIGLLLRKYLGMKKNNSILLRKN